MPRVRCSCGRLAVDADGLCAACLGMPEAARQTVVALCTTWGDGQRLIRQLRALGVDVTTVTPATVRAVWRALQEDA